MKHLLKQVSNAPYAIAAAATVAMSSPAFSQTIGDQAKNVKKEVGQIGQLVVAGAFLGGIVMLATGLMKLKQAADTQGNQVKYSEGMWRIAVGAGLIGVPALSGMLGASLGLGDGGNITAGGGDDVSW